MKTLQVTKELALTVNANLSTNAQMLSVSQSEPKEKTFLNVSGQISLNSKQLGNFNQRFELTAEDLDKPVSLSEHDEYLENLGLDKLKTLYNLS